MGLVFLWYSLLSFSACEGKSMGSFYSDNAIWFVQAEVSRLTASNLGQEARVQTLQS